MERVGRLCTQAEDSESFLRSIYSPGAEGLSLERVGTVWEAAHVAADLGLRARGRRVAVIDAGFDLTLEPLARVADSASEIKLGTADRYGHHGSVVAMLIHEVAPEAALILLDIAPITAAAPITANDVTSAIVRARDLKADVINLSLEFKSDLQRPADPLSPVDHRVFWSSEPDVDSFVQSLDGFIHNIDFWYGCGSSCTICNAIAALPMNVVVVSASGNHYQTACPASSKRCLGIGFERQTLVEADGHVLRLANLPSSFRQRGLAELTIPQPAGFQGTSFAAPLVTALMSVVTDPNDLLAMARFPVKFWPVGTMLRTVQRLGRATKAQLECISKGFVRLMDEVPASHKHWDSNVSVGPCVPCSMFAVDWYRDYISFLTSTGDLVGACHLGAIGEGMAPYSAEVIGNYAVASRERALSVNDQAERYRRLESSGKRFRKAAALRPQVAMYATEASAVESLAASIKENLSK